MTKSFAPVAALALAALAASVPAYAVDPWEGGAWGDDTSSTNSTLSPGLVQQHDLQETGANDVDWTVVPTLQYHSYEARISGSTAPFDWGTCGTCAQFERVNGSGTILTEDVATVNNGPGGVSEAYDRSVRWVASGSTIQEYVRVAGASNIVEDANYVYTLRYWDTTYTVPRWNSSNGQVTVFVITSLVQGHVTGNIYFFSGTGALLHTKTLSLDPNVPYVLNTASIGTLTGQSGFALVAHDGGYGGLTGKAVALEPATGFTFDTALQPIEQ